METKRLRNRKGEAARPMRNACTKPINRGKALAFFFEASKRSRDPWQHDFTRERHRVQGQGPAKVLTWVRRCSIFRKVSILENPGDFFEDAHPFPRCSPKIRTLLTPDNALGADCRTSAALKQDRAWAFGRSRAPSRLPAGLQTLSGAPRLGRGLRIPNCGDQTREPVR
jgi:hypothetical protein